MGRRFTGSLPPRYFRNKKQTWKHVCVPLKASHVQMGPPAEGRTLSFSGMYFGRSHVRAVLGQPFHWIKYFHLGWYLITLCTMGTIGRRPRLAKSPSRATKKAPIDNKVVVRNQLKSIAMDRRSGTPAEPKESYSQMDILPMNLRKILLTR